MTLAILLSFLVAPLVKWLGRLKLGHVASVFAAVVMSISVIGVLGAVITDAVERPRRGHAALSGDDRAQDGSGAHADGGQARPFCESRGPGVATRDRRAAATRAAPRCVFFRWPRACRRCPSKCASRCRTPLEVARRVLSPAISPLETAFIVFVVMVVILLQRDDSARSRDSSVRFARSAPHDDGDGRSRAARRAATSFRSSD